MKQPLALRALLGCICVALVGAVLTLPLLCAGCGQVDPAKVSTTATRIAAIYFAQQQAQINLMPAGPERDKAQAKLYSQETTGALAVAVGQVVAEGATTVRMPAVVPAQPTK